MSSSLNIVSLMQHYSHNFTVWIKSIIRDVLTVSQHHRDKGVLTSSWTYCSFKRSPVSQIPAVLKICLRAPHCGTAGEETASLALLISPIFGIYTSFYIPSERLEQFGVRCACAAMIDNMKKHILSDISIYC